MLNRKWVRIVLLSLPLLFILGCIFLRDTAYGIADNLLPPCNTYVSLGVLCPGCGLTRCIMAVMDGDLLLALRSNAAVVFLFLCIGLFYAEIVLLSFGKDVRILPRKVWFWVTVGIIAAVYFVARNYIPELAPLPAEWDAVVEQCSPFLVCNVK